MIKRDSTITTNSNGNAHYKYTHVPRTIINEKQLVQALLMKLRRTSACYEQWRYFIAVQGVPETQDLKTPFLAIKHHNQTIMCCFGKRETQRWVKHNGIVVTAEHSTNAQLDVSSLKMQYMQYSKHVLNNRVSDRDSPRYDPELDYIQQFIKKWNIKF